MEERKCKKCNCIIYGLGDDYWCPICQNEYCYNCIKKHGCSVETETVGNKSNYVIPMEAMEEERRIRNLLDSD